MGATSAARWHFTGLGVSLLLVAATACGGADQGNGASAGDEAAEAAYLADVGSALDLFDERNDVMRDALGQTYQTNEALFSALTRAGAGTAFEPGLAALQALDPPAELRAGHALLLERQRELVSLDREIGRAVADGDLVHFVLLNMRLALAGSHSAIKLEQPLCGVVAENVFDLHPTQSAEYLAGVMCDRSELPGGEYSSRMRDILRPLSIDLAERGPALGFFDLVPIVPGDARLEVAQETFSEIASATKHAIGEISAMEVPDRMAHDHDRLLAYLAESEMLIDETTAAIARADLSNFAARDLPELYCEARDEVGFAYRPIVRVYFADAFGWCPGAGEF